MLVFLLPVMGCRLPRHHCYVLGAPERLGWLGRPFGLLARGVAVDAHDEADLLHERWCGVRRLDGNVTSAKHLVQRDLACSFGWCASAVWFGPLLLLLLLLLLWLLHCWLLRLH